MKNHNNWRTIEWSNYTTKPALRAIIIGLVLVILNTSNGVIAIMTYITYLFKDIGSNLSPNESGIVASAIQFIGVCIATQLVDHIGRKVSKIVFFSRSFKLNSIFFSFQFLIITSSIGSVLGLLVFGTYMMLKSWNFDVQTVSWIPLVSFSFVLFMVAAGIQSLTFTLISEILPENIKDTCSFLCSMFLWGLVFVNVKFLPFFNETIGLHGIAFMFAGICLISVAIIIVIMPETKGKSREEIQKLLE